MYEHMRGIIDGLRQFQTLQIPANAFEASQDSSLSGISYLDVEQISQSRRMIEGIISAFEAKKDGLFKDMGLKNFEEMQAFLKQ